MNIFIEKFKKYISGSGTNYIVLLGLVGVIFLTLGEVTPNKPETSESMSCYQDYKTDIENQLEKILSSVKLADSRTVNYACKSLYRLSLTKSHNIS